jgi:predicted DNA-binding protein (MmcQ/YjbR family)
MPSQQAVLKRLRTICRRLPETIETTTFGHPTFQAGKKKTFVVLDDHERDGALCIVFKASLDEQKKLVGVAHFFPCKFGAKHGWTSLVVDAALDWKQVEALVIKSYRLLANRRMIAALEDASTRGGRAAK